MSQEDQYIRGCRYCSYKNRDRKLLQEHQLKCGSSKKYKCKFCNWAFDYGNALSGHMKRHEREAVLGGVTCIYCEQIFADNTILIEHLPIHEEYDIKKGYSKCPQCSWIGLHSRLVDHIRTHTDESLCNINQEMPYIRLCRYCPYKNEDRRSLREHELNCGKDRRFKCDVCQRRFPVMKDLRTHIRCHERLKSKEKLSCLYCEETFDDKLILYEHLPIHEEFDCQRQSGTRSGAVCKCPHCGIISERGYSHMVSHVATHTGKKEMECNLCSQKFVQKAALKVHLAAHENTKVDGGVTCLYCNLKLEDRTSLIVHLKTHPEVKNERGKTRAFRCPQCNFVAPGYSNLVVHYVIHTGILNYECTICGKRFRDSLSLRVHESLHTNTPMYSCEYCGLKMWKTEDRIRHQKSHLDSDGRVHFICQLCGEDVKTAENYLAHYEAHRTCLCDYCGRGFETNLMKLRHMWRIHKENKAETSVERRKQIEEELGIHHLVPKVEMVGTKTTYMCDYCGKETFDITSFKLHERTHTGEKPYICSICGRGFSQVHSRDNHEKTHERSNAPKTCLDCKEKFEDRSVFEEHIKLHADYKHYECDVCGRRFAKAYQRKQHELSHNDEKLLSCDICNSCFSHSNSLKKHMEFHANENEKGFLKNCLYCNENITVDHMTFLAHLRSHDYDKEDNSYGCPHCNIKVKTLKVFQRHMEKHKKRRLPNRETQHFLKSKSGSYVTEVSTDDTEFVKEVTTVYEIQVQRLPLSTSVYQLSLERNKIIFLVWTKRLELDLLTLARGNQCICLLTKDESTNIKKI